MTPASIQKTVGPPAPCRKARTLLVGVAAVTGLLVLTMGADLLLQARCEPDTTETWMRTLALSAPALWPAGSPMRHPETVHPGVDLRFVIGMEILP